MIIIGLIVVIVALVAGLAMMLTGNDISSDVQVPEGMQEYNFNSAFTMVVKDDAKFLKVWDSISAISYVDYYNKEDNYVIQFSKSDLLIGNEDNFVDILNSSKSYDITKEGDLYVCKVLNKSEKFSVGNSEKHFDYRVFRISGDNEVIISGNDLDSLKEMASTIKFRGDSNEK